MNEPIEQYGWASPSKQGATHNDKKWLDLIRKELFLRMDLASTNKAQQNSSYRIDAFDHLRDRCAQLERMIDAVHSCILPDGRFFVSHFCPNCNVPYRPEQNDYDYESEDCPVCGDGGSDNRTYRKE